MTKEEIIEMACQAFGGVIKKEERDNFINFAKLVAEKEREACADLCKKLFSEDDSFYGEFSDGNSCAESIRARGQE